MDTSIPIFPGMPGEPEHLKLSTNDLAFELENYAVVRSGNKIGISLKGDEYGISEEVFFNILGFSELSKLAKINLTSIDYNSRGFVQSAKIELFVINPLSN